MKIKVVFRGESKKFVVEETDMMDDLLLVFRRVFEVDNNTTEFRVLSKGRDISTEKGDMKTLVGEDGKVMIIGSEGRDLQVTMKKKDKIQPRPVAALNISESAMRKRYQSGPSTSSHIGAIHELSGLPRSNEARDILLKIASDPGIKGVIEKHKFKVGILTELHPIETKVELRGLNKNMGQEILLKLRNRSGPNDIDLFLPYTDIRDTMLHELTHNVHGPHDDKFYTLFRQLVKEQKSLDWSTGGRRVGGSDVYQPPPTDYSSNQTYSGGARVLGGDMEKYNEITKAGYTPSQVAYIAATLRLTEQEKKCEDGCGSSAVMETDLNDNKKSEIIQPMPAPIPVRPNNDSIDKNNSSDIDDKISQPPQQHTEQDEQVSCPVCQELLPSGCSARFISNHVESCVKPPPLPEEIITQCPICELSFPEGSSERYVTNHVSQCAIGGCSPKEEASLSSQPVTIPVAAAPAPVLKLNTSSELPTQSSVPCADTAPVHACPICCDPFPEASSERFRNNHVEQCMLKEAA